MPVTLVSRALNRPDPILVKEQLAALQYMYSEWGAEAFAKYMIWILNKKTDARAEITHSRLIPFTFNRIQRDIEANKGKKNIFLKPRQAGYTTWCLLRRGFIPSILEPGTNSFLISQSGEKATEHFAMLRRAYKYIGATEPANPELNYLTKALHENLLHTSYSNRKELIFDQLDNRIGVGSAEVLEAGQGSCILGSTWITDWNFNLKKFRTVEIGDELVDGQGNKCRVKKKFIIPKKEHPYKGNAIKIDLRSLKNFPVTGAPNHPFLTQRGMLEAQHLEIGDFLAYPKRSLKTKKYSIQLRNVIDSGFRSNEQGTKIKLTRDFGFLMGMYLGDGVHQTRGMFLVMSAPRKLSFGFDRLIKTLDNLKLGVSKAKIKKHGIQFNNAQFADWIIENFGKTSAKHIPEWWQEAPKEFLFGMLEGWITADAWWEYFRDSKKTIIRQFVGYSKAAPLIFGMREICISLGLGLPFIQMSRRKNSRRVINGRECNCKGVKFSLLFGSEVTRNIASKMGLKTKQCREDRLDKRRTSWYQDNKYVYIKIQKLTNTHVSKFYDITVDSPDHLYSLPNCVTHNTLHRIIASEVARWPGVPEETLANLKEALILDGTLDIESTADGAGENYFYEEYFRAKRGESEFTPHFHQWWWDEGYRIELTDSQKTEMEADLAEDERNLMAKFHLELEQIAFRREKKRSLRHNFDEKYPEDEITCLTGSTAVVLADGSLKPIEWIVKHKYAGKVQCVNKQGQIISARITNWYRSPRKERKLYRLEFENAKNSHHGKVHATVTEEHKVLTEDGWLRADEANGKLIATGTPAPGSRAFQIILGTILGDGHVSNRRLSSSQVCSELINSKAKVLSNLGGHSWSMSGKRKKKKLGGDGSWRKPVRGFSAGPYPYFQWMRSIFYPQGLKTFPKWMLENLDDFGIAVWFMDDGWSNFNKKKQSPNSRSDGGIHLGLISHDIGETVAEILTDRGYECNCLSVNDNAYHVIKFTCDGIERLYKAIGKYVIPAMRYKLPDYAPKFEAKWWRKEPAKMFWDKAVITEAAIPMQKKGQYEKGPLYCIDVEGTHNFLTLGGIVHNCFLVSGSSYFDKDILRVRMLEIQGVKPYKSFAGGLATIYQKAIPRRLYVIGADPASGKKIGSGTDWSAAKVIDLDTGEEVASYHAQISPEDFALDLEQLGRHYNDALIAVERGVGADAGGEGGTVLLTLVNQKYSNIYKHKEWWKRDRNTQASIVIQEGFPMTGRTRPVALNKLRFMVENNPELFNDPLLLRECMMFVRDDKGRPAAAEGSHDDMVLASGIAQAVRMIVLGYWDPLIARRERYGDTPQDEAAPEELS